MCIHTLYHSHAGVEHGCRRWLVRSKKGMDVVNDSNCRARPREREACSGATLRDKVGVKGVYIQVGEREKKSSNTLPHTEVEIYSADKHACTLRRTAKSMTAGS